MDSIQSKCIELLDEINEVCKENGLVYCLSPRTTARAIIYGDLGVGNNELDVYMPVDDALKFIEIINRGADKSRFVEYMGNSKMYSSFCADYVNEDTTYIELKLGTNYSHYGIGVTVQLIRNDNTDKLSSLLELGWESNGYRLFRKLDPFTIVAFCLVRVMMVIGRKNLSKKIFKKLSSVYGGNIEGKRTFVQEYKMNPRYFTAGTFDILNKIKLGEREYPVPKDIETYLVDFYGPGWRDMIINTSGGRNAVQIADVPYKEYLKYLDNCGRPLKHILREQRMTLLRGAFAFKHFNAWKKAWDIACRSGDRLNFYEEFQLKKERINNLYANKEYEELDEIFAEHEMRLRYYEKNNLGLCVSEEILEIQCQLLKNRGEGELANRVRSLVPKEHKRPLKTLE